MTVFLFLPRFYLGPHEKDSPLTPLVVVRERAVLDMSEEAESSGVRVGMPVRQARAILQDASFVAWKEEDHREAQGRWLDVCARFTSIVEPLEQHAAWLDLSAHPRPVELIARLRQEIEQTTGLKARLGVARAKWLAQVAAEVGDDDYQALNYPQAFLTDLPVAMLTPVLPEHRQRLQFLGYRNAGSVASVPLSTLRSQFGERAHAIRQASLGRGSAQIAALYPLDALQSEIHFPGATDSLLTLENGMGALAKKLGQHLIDRERQGSTMRVFVELESGKIFVRERRFTKPVRCPRTALAALKLLLSEPPEEPVASLRVMLRELERTARSQMGLLGDIPAGEKDTRIASAFSYVRTVFGDCAVVQASQVEIPRRVRVLKEWKDATGWR